MGFDNECILNIQSLPGEYFCPVCRTLVYPSEALQAQCTHLYCKPCLAYVVATTRACPYDGYLVTEADSKPLVESNKSIADGINNIQVHCLYHRSGCSWQGMFSECITHCAECGFGNSPVVCNRCGTQIIHRQVQEHAQICPGVQPQAQQVEGTSVQTSAGQNQSAPQAVAHASQVPSSQSAAATAAGTSSSAPITGVSAAISSATQTASSGQILPQNSGLAQVTPTPDQWYQQQQLQYQQYYQQYPGYDPYQQHYEQSGQYQQQAQTTQLQYPQPYVQSNSQQAVQGQQPLPYIQPQPQAFPVSQTHSHPQIPPVAQSHSQSQAQQPVQPQTLPQSQLHGHPQTQMHGPVPQLQATLNPQQQQLPHLQMQPQSHSAPPTGLPQSQPLHTPTQGTQIQAPSHPQFQHTSTPQSSQSHVPLTQPHSQSHTQAYPQQPPQQQPHSHPHQIPPQSHPQHPPAHAVSGHQSYPQPQGQQQFPPSAAQQHPVHYPQQQGLPYQQPQLNVQMHNQFPHQQPPQIRPAQSQAPMQAQMGMRPPHLHQPPVQLQMHHHPGRSQIPSAQVQSQQSVRPQVLPYSQQVPAVGQTRLQQAPPFLQATVSSHSSSGQHVGLAPQAALLPSGGNSSSKLVAPGNLENAFDGRKNEYATNKTEQAAATDVDGTSASKIQKQEDPKHGEEKSAIVAEDNTTQPSDVDVETVPESSFDGKENKEGISTRSNYKEENNGSMEFARSKEHQLDDNPASKVINGEKESEKSIHGYGVEEQEMLKSPNQGTTQCDGRGFDIQSKISGTPSQSRPPPSDMPNIPYGSQNMQGNVPLRAPAPDMMMPQQMSHCPPFGSNFPRPPVQSFPQSLPHQGPGQPMSVPDPFHQPSRQPPGAFPAVAGTPSLGRALGPAGPGMAAQLHAKGQNHPLNAESKMPYADSMSGRPLGGLPAGSFDPSTAMLHRGHGTDGHRYRPGHPDLGDRGHFHDRSPGFYNARPQGPRPSWPLERGPLDQQPGAQHNMSINGPPGNAVEPSFHGSADERFRPLPDERFRHPTGERFRKEFEDDLKQFPRPTSLDREAVPKFDNHFPSARIHERGSHNLGPDSGYRSFDRPFDGNAGAIPSRKLPPFPSDAPHADSISGSYFHSLDAGERQRFHDNFARNEFGHPNFNRPSDYGPHRMDGRSFRSSGQDFANISSSRFGPGGMLHDDEYHERDLRGMGEHSRLFGHPSEPHGNIFHEGRFPNLSPPSGVSSHFRRNEFSASGNMLDFPGSRMPGAGPGGFSHLRHGEPGYGSNYSPHGGSLHGDPFDHSRKRKHGSVGWCRICKIDCETVEGLDLHSQTREHQKMAMDIVLSIKQNNAKKKKLTMEGNMSLDEASKVKKPSTEARKNKH